MKLPVLFCLTVGALAAQPILGPYTSAMNDLAELSSVSYQNNVVKMPVPLGYQIRVLRIYGSVTAWSRYTYSAPVNHLTIEFSLSPAGFPTSGPAATCGDSCFLHLAYTIDNNTLNQPFDISIVNGVLRSDLPNSGGVMDEVTSITFNELPTEPVSIHTQMTFTMVYQLEPVTDFTSYTLESCIACHLR